MWGIESVCDLRRPGVKPARSWERHGCRQIEFANGWARSILDFRDDAMNITRHFSDALGIRLRACVCLLAVLLLWAPAWAGAFQASQAACCASGMCPLHGHAPKKGSSDAQGAKQSPVATCEHHGRSAAMDCSVACCHPDQPALTGAVAFLLPDVALIGAPHLAGASIIELSPQAGSFVFDAVTPPPRSLPLSL